MPNLNDRLVRYCELKACRNAFIDTRSPGSEMKENFTIIGPGVGENPNQHVHIREAHGFNVSAARQPLGCLNSQHSHDYAEVFVNHAGHWRLTFGVEAGEDGYVDIAPGDVVTVPIHMFRGFRKLDEGSGFLLVPLAQDDPGKVVWSPKVYDLAKQYGLVLLKGGRLIDTTQGEVVPEGAEIDTGPSSDVIGQLSTPSLDKFANLKVAFADMQANPKSAIAGAGVEECPIIGPRDTEDGFQAGPIIGWWPHGFCLRLIRMQSGAQTGSHERDEEEVLFVQRGTFEVTTPDGSVIMAAGDTFTTPKGRARKFRCLSSDGCEVFVIRGGEAVGAPRFVSAQAAE